MNKLHYHIERKQPKVKKEISLVFISYIVRASYLSQNTNTSHDQYQAVSSARVKSVSDAELYMSALIMHRLKNNKYKKIKLVLNNERDASS